MKSFNLITAALLSGFVLTGFNSAVAAPVSGAQSYAMPAEPKLQVFSFDPNTSFTILSRPNSVTDLVLGPDEKLVALAAGDTVQWIFNKTSGHIFIKPLRSDLFTSATLVTSKRTYQLTLRSVPERAFWYQRVSWNYPDEMLLEDSSFAKSVNGNQTVAASLTGNERPFPAEKSTYQQSSSGIGTGVLSSSSARPTKGTGGYTTGGQNITPDKFNYNYKVSGSAEFKPDMVFDDGKFIWMRIKDSQELPAVFMYNADGDTEIVNWVKKGNYLVVQRLAPGVLLKIGSTEVKVLKDY